MVKLGLFLAMLVLSVGAVLTVSADSKPKELLVPSAPPNGIWGITLFGPITPVCHIGQPCEVGRSVALRVSDANGGRVFYSDQYGLFMVSLPPGHYILSQAADRGAFKWSPQLPVDVLPGQYTKVVFHIDSGLR